MTRAIKISEYFLLVAISTIFFKKPILLGTHEFKLSVFFFSFFVISVLFIFIAVFKKQINILSEKKLISVFLLSFLTIVLGSFISFFIFNKAPDVIVIKEYSHFLTDFIIFWEIIILSKNNPQFSKKAFMAFLFSLLVIPLFYLYLFITKNVPLYLILGTTRFEGFFSDPNYYGNFQIIPTLLLLFFIIKNNQTNVKKILSFILFSISVGTILWSGSRAGLVGLIISFAMVITFMIRRIQMKTIILTSMIIFISFPVGYLLLPSKIHDNISARLDQITVKSTGTHQALPNLTGGQDRNTIWKGAFTFVKDNPFGYGPGYYETIDIVADGEDHRVAHNFELGILLTGGILLFVLLNISLYYLISKPFKSDYFKNFNEIHILIAILAGLLVSGMFHDFFLLEWMWIIPALILAYHRKLSFEQDQNSKA